MNLLDRRQSEMLKRISIGPIIYSTLPEKEKSICDFLQNLGYIFYQITSTNYSTHGVFREYSATESAFITEKGRMYLLNEQLSDDQRNFLKEQINSLKSIADSAQKQANLATITADNAEKESKIARKDALFSKIVSIITILISIGSVIVSVIS